MYTAVTSLLPNVTELSPWPVVPTPMTIWLTALLLLTLVFDPKRVLLIPSLIVSPALLPITVLLFPLVFLSNTLSPIPIFSCPVVVLDNVEWPIAILENPLVNKFKVWSAIPILYRASSVRLSGRFSPINKESLFVSTSLKSFKESTLSVFAVICSCKLL